MIRAKHLLGYLVVVVVALWIVAAPTAADQSMPSDIAAAKLALWGEDRRLALTSFAPLPGTENDMSAAADSDALAGAFSATRVVFQAARDYNWEIYIARPDGSGLRRATNSPAVDSNPSLNRGATQIAFGSSRNGNYDIYRVEVGVWDPKRLTRESEDESVPAWSPDSSRIAYQRKSGANWEIWVMNADGSNQVRLTNDPASDVGPAWSPDGRSIAWVQATTAGNAIMVMAADGTGAHPVARNLPFLGSISWSPDGANLGFDYDHDGDGWNEIASIPSVGGPITLIYDPGGLLVDAWMGAWSPVSPWLACTLVYYRQSDEQFEIVDIRITYALAPNAPQPGGGVSFPSVPTDMLPDWQTADLAAPHSRLEPLAAESPFNFAVKWTGEDVGEAGVGSFDIQVREGATGSWQDWQMASISTFSEYMGVGGVNYQFRVRARDAVGNEEPWPVAAQASTTVEAKPPITRVNALPDQSAYSFEVTWGGEDPGGSAICAYDVQRQDGANGVWTDWLVDVQTSSEWVTGTHGEVFAFRSRGRDCAGNVEAWPAQADTQTTIETLPPRVTVAPLPAFARLPGGVLSWHGVDLGGSGVANYDVQIQDLTSAGAWRDLTSEQEQEQGIVDGEGGHTYRFRVRARDRAGNVGPWAESPGAGVTLYAWTLGGTVRDVVGRAVGGVEVRTDPPAFAGTIAGEDGRFQAYLAEVADPISVTWQQSGHDALPLTPFQGSEDVLFDPVLPPRGNAIRDGDFESGGIGSAWQTGGAYPLAWSGAGFTGLRSAALGQERGLLPGEPVGAVSENVSNPQVYGAMDNSGALHVVWHNTQNLYYQTRSPSGGWSAQVRIADDCWELMSPLAVGRDGVVHVVWASEAKALLYAQRGANGVWSVPQTIEDGELLRYVLAADAAGNLHLVWLVLERDRWEWVTYYAYRPAAGGWQPARKLNEGVTLALLLAVDGRGDAHIAWQKWGAAGANIMYAHRAGDGVWSDPAVAATSEDGIDDLRLVADGLGRAHFVWLAHSVYQVFHAGQDAAGKWSAPQQISKGDYWLPPQSLTVAAGSEGQVHVAWINEWEFSSIAYVVRSAAGIWEQPQNLTLSQSRGGRLQLALDAAGRGHLTWRSHYTVRETSGQWRGPFDFRLDTGEYPGPSSELMLDQRGGAHIFWLAFEASSGTTRLMHAQTQAAPVDGATWLRQAVIVPPAAERPVLSFLYRLEGADQDAGGLLVQVEAGAPASTIFSTGKDTPGWTHRWVDLSAWAGRSVTVTFLLQQVAGRPAARAFLDDVSVGASARADLYVMSVAQHAAAGELVAFSILYGNRGDGLAADTQLTVTLPSELTFRSAEPPPAAGGELIWHLGDLAPGAGPGIIVLRAQVAADVPDGRLLAGDAQLSIVASETSRGNNHARLLAFIGGRRLYLPLIR